MYGILVLFLYTSHKLSLEHFRQYILSTFVPHPRSFIIIYLFSGKLGYFRKDIYFYQYGEASDDALQNHNFYYALPLFDFLWPHSVDKP